MSDTRSWIRFEGIYLLRNVVTGECYVGQSANLVLRFKMHRWTLRAGRSKNRELQASFDQHGEAAFEFKMLEFCDTIPGGRRERYWIDKLRPVFNHNDRQGRFGPRKALGVKAKELLA